MQGRSRLLHRARDGATMLLVVGGLAFLCYTFLVVAPERGTVGADAWAYWRVTMPHPYAIPLGELGAFTYSPPFALVMQSARLLDWSVFLWLWMAALLATVIWLGGRRALLVLAFPPVIIELYYGNVNLLIAAAIVLGFRHPWTWAFVLLTKPTCGVGLLWFAARREWRALGVALGATAAIAGVSLVVAPQLWAEWLRFLATSSSSTPSGAWLPVPLWIRMPAAAALVVWGARTDRRWTVAVSVAIALPVIWFAGLAVLAALVRERPGSRARTPERPVVQRPPGTAPIVA